MSEIDFRPPVIEEIPVAALAKTRGFRASPAALYLASLATPKTVQTGKEVMRRICKLFRRKSPDAWTTFPWEKLTIQETTFVRRTLMERVSPSTLRLTLSVLRSILFQAYKADYITHEAFYRATTWPKLKAHTEPTGRSLTDEELVRLRAHLLELPGAYGEMTMAIFAVGIGAGLRREELASLGADALGADGTLFVLGKNQKEARVDLLDGAAKDLTVWLTTRHRLNLKSPTMFISLSSHGRCHDVGISPHAMAERVVSAMQAAGIEDATTHDLRRTYASRLLERSDLGTVKGMMRHENIATTAGYDRRWRKRAKTLAESIPLWPESEVTNERKSDHLEQEK